MIKKKEKENSSANELNKLINEKGIGSFTGFENIFDDVATSINNLFESPLHKKDKK
jgi:hypothetical protein